MPPSARTPAGDDPAGGLSWKMGFFRMVSIDGERLSSRHLGELRASAIDADQNAARGTETILNRHALPPAFTGNMRVPGLLFPIWNTRGENVAWQLKPDGGWIGKDGKPAKYLTAGPICLDVPPAARPYLRDTEAVLWITEGCKKVDSAASNGIPCTIGVQGVWMWRSDRVVLPDWDDIALKGRTCILAFDSDVMRKASPRKALESLAATLAYRGAIVRYCLMPDLPEGSKCGLDDAFAAGLTRDDLEELIVDTLPGSGPTILQTRRASDIEAREIDWLWKPWLPAGMLTLFAGYGGGGKSTVALSIAAACSTGGRLPDGQAAPQLSTLVFAAEDSPEHTIIPRLTALGANLDRIHVVDGIPQGDGDPGWVQLRAHVAMIEQTVRQLGIGLVILDPVSSFIGDANSDKESDVRAALSPLVKMSERTGCAVLMIRHVSKAGNGERAASRILGSTAWHDLPRVAWMLADAPADHQPEPREDGTRDTRRVLGIVKTNLAAKPQDRWFLQPVDGPMRWLPEASPVSIDECFYAHSDRKGAGRDIDEWLTDFLKGTSKTLREMLDAAGDRYREKAVRASLQRIGAEKYQLPGKAHGGWYWRLPVANGEPAGSSNVGDASGESDRQGGTDPSTRESSVSEPIQVRNRPAIQGNPLPRTGSGNRLSFVTFPISLRGESGQETGETLLPTGTDGARPGEIEL